MQGDSAVIDHLNKLLTGELTAVDQYFQHSRMYQDWGLHKLYTRIDHEKDDEQRHANALIERILFLEGTPDLASRHALKIGRDVPEMLRNDLDLEYQVARELREAIAYCEQVQDFVTRRILVQLLDDTE